MGRYAQAARRGGVGPDKTGIGPLAPVSGQFSVASSVATHISVTGIGAFPANAVAWNAYRRVTSVGGAYTPGNSTNNPTGVIDLSGLVSTTQYDIVTAYVDANGVIASQFSPIKTQVCA